MAMKKVLAFTIAALFICSVFIETTKANTYIGYGGLGKGGIPCKDGNCHRETPANEYTRGCSKEQRYRSPGAEKGDNQPI
ncbi:hypothetical protein AQUCO_05000053v1 [Aquilegia coerulea]|uniref:Uncharacterized protein n=1 Tax=Aquilegia coerulea TaxID=218851 RepID=A0A2G5CKM0_AQUCA|nr:hypothetical protein AQUCO_05000053v1 [Aquilegia coerulea]